jgi:protein TonB
MAPAPAPAAPSVAEPAPNVPAAARAEPAPAPSVQAFARAEPERPSAASASAPAPAPAAVSAPRFDAAYLQNPAPVYPALSRRMKEQGKVMLRVHVSPNGAADQVELRDSSGSARLDTAALETVKRWRFLPARQGEQSVPAWVLVPISFYLEG